MGDRHRHGACMPALPHTFTARHECQPEEIKINNKNKKIKKRILPLAKLVSRCRLATAYLPARACAPISDCAQQSPEPHTPPHHLSIHVQSMLAPRGVVVDPCKGIRAVRTYAPLRPPTSKPANYNTCSALCS